jgi:TolB-like protein/class 3 adenylate cyclase
MAATARAERRLAAILAADVVGYSRPVEADEAGTLAAIRELRRAVVDPLLAEHRGRIVKLMGDGAIVEFGSVVDAVACAAALQKEVAEHQVRVPPGRRIVFRIGVNLGDVVVEGEDLLGDGVNVAARLEQLCEPGGVLVSSTAYDHLQGKLDVPLEFAGERHLKNIDRPVRAYRVRLDGARAALPPPRTSRRRAMPAAAAVLLALLLAAGAASWGWLRPGEPGLAGRPSIAVLPFDNLGGDEAAGRLADGITEDVITELSRFRDFDVIARNSTEVYKGKPVDVRQVGRDLNVRYVLEGSIQRQGDRVRVTAQLIDADSGAHVWSERWDRPAGDLFAVQTEIAEQAANRIGGWGVVVEAERRAARRKRPEDLSAYELYLRGIDAMQRETKEGNQGAIRLLTEAAERDPTLARAWTALAAAHDYPVSFGAGLHAAEAEAEAEAEEAAERAVAIDPMDAEAHRALAEVLGTLGDFARAEAASETALRLNPGHAAIPANYASWARARSAVRSWAPRPPTGPSG